MLRFIWEGVVSVHDNDGNVTLAGCCAELKLCGLKTYISQECASRILSRFQSYI